MAQRADGVMRQPGPLRRLRRFWRDARTVGVGLRELLDEHGIDRVSLLKCDIEGAEVALFGPTYRAWLDRVDA
ncbi:MAG: FkbM family methyltransferase, partial [Planctomycetes bacterium]|nr:FkbM family methyltransferase [Planctomycetota bacterium]